jgi:hypothetical protein
MKKSILHFGTTLDKKEQQRIHGGFYACYSSHECFGQYDCCSGGTCINSAYAIFEPFCT